MRREAPLVLALAIVCGGLAAYATVRLLGERTPVLGVASDGATIAMVEPADDGVRLQLAGGRMLRVDTTNDAANARNMALLYAGKTVTVRKRDDCWRVVPLMQTDPPTLDGPRYRALQERGLSDADLAWAFAPPPEGGWSSVAVPPRTTVDADRLAVCASAETD